MKPLIYRKDINVALCRQKTNEVFVTALQDNEYKLY